MSWEVRVGNALTRLAEMPDESVQCCVTSPPYFGLRDYGIDGQIGLERTPDEFVARLVEAFREVRRVLRADGTLWLNIGDSYANDTKWGGSSGGKHVAALHGASGIGRGRKRTGLKGKDLIGVPWMLAFALRADGWYLRSDVIWAKPNPMPESVTDRPTSAHEHVFLLSKSARYFYDADAIREPHSEVSLARAQRNRFGGKYEGADATEHGALKRGNGYGPDGDPDIVCSPGGRNKRNVWEVATQPYADAHFATFPPKLVEPCILAGSSPKACGECGTPWERMTGSVEVKPDLSQRTTAHYDTAERYGAGNGGNSGFDRLAAKMRAGVGRGTTGWQPSCSCHRRHCVSCTNPENGRPDSRCCDCTGAEPIYETLPGAKSCVILDPFAGAGTTGLVALRHDRSFIGIELKPAYAELARERIRQDAPLMNTSSEVVA